MEIQWSARLGQQENRAQDAQKGRPARPQRAKRRRRTVRDVELLSEARTPLADFFSILLTHLITGGDLLNAKLYRTLVTASLSAARLDKGNPAISEIRATPAVTYVSILNIGRDVYR